MLFLCNRVVLTAISAFVLFQLTAARPLLWVPQVSSSLILDRANDNDNSLIEDNALVKRSEASKNALLEHDYVGLYRRKGLGGITKEPKANPFKSKTKPASAPVDKPRPQNNQNQRKALPNNTKLKLGDNARFELDKMGLHGKPRRNMIKWHKTQVKNEMKTNPLLKGKAHTGVIQ